MKDNYRNPIMVFCAAVLAAAAGCTGAPTAPTAGPAAPQSAIVIAPELRDAWALLRATPGRPGWTTGDETIAAWLAHVPITRIEIGTLPIGTSGMAYGGGRIVINAGIIGSRPAVLAAIIAHEARHVDGSRHSCGETKDQTFGELGAWAVHVLTLELLREDGVAATLRAEQFCEEAVA